MKIFLYFFIVITGLLANTQDIPTYNIKPIQINHIEYKTQDNILILEIKKDYWETLFDFSLANIYNQVNIHFDDIKMSPYIMGALFSNIQIQMPYEQNLSSNLKKILVNHNTNQKININEKNTFLQKMLQKYPNNYHIVQQLIHNFHEINTPLASQLAIDTYESIDDMNTNQLLMKNDYSYIFDCYNDLNRTNEALKILDLAQEFIAPNEEYLLIEQKGFLFNNINQKSKAKLYYEEALKCLKRTNFMDGILGLDEKQKEEIEALKNNEIQRLQSILKSFSLVTNKTS